MRKKVFYDLSVQAIAAIIASVGFSLLTALFPPFRRWIVEAVRAAFVFLASDVTVPWAVLMLLILGTLALLLGIVRRFFSQSASPYAIYQQDTFDGLVWRWKFLSDEMMTL